MVETSENATPEAAISRLSLGQLAPLLAIAAAIVAFFVLGWDQYLSFESLGQHRQELMQWTENNYLQAALGFIAVYTVVIVLSLPGGSWMTLAGGFMFGSVNGSIFVVLSATLGAVGIFLIARHALADYCRAKMGDAGRRMEDGFKDNELSYLLFLRLVPLFPFWLVNLVPALLGVSLRNFVIGTFLGIIPGTAVYASVGNGLGAVFEAGGTPDMEIIFEPKILGPIIGLAVLSLVPIVYKKLRAKKVNR